MIKFNIRKASLHAPVIANMFRELAVSQLGNDKYFTGSLDFPNADEMVISAINNENCCITVIDTENGIGGFAETWIYPPDFHFYVSSYAYVLHFFVNPELRNNTAVAKLFRSTEEFAKSRGQKYLVADAFEHNQRVQKVLNFVGMKPYRVRMAKDLSSTDKE